LGLEILFCLKKNLINLKALKNRSFNIFWTKIISCNYSICYNQVVLKKSTLTSSRFFLRNRSQQQSFWFKGGPLSFLRVLNWLQNKFIFQTESSPLWGLKLQKKWIDQLSVKKLCRHISARFHKTFYALNLLKNVISCVIFKIKKFFYVNKTVQLTTAFYKLRSWLFQAVIVSLLSFKRWIIFTLTKVRKISVSVGMAWR